MNSTCQIRADALDAYTHDMLNAAQRAKVETHVGECEDCRRRLSAIEAEGAALGFGLRRMDVPPLRKSARDLVALYAPHAVEKCALDAEQAPAAGRLRRAAERLSDSYRRTGLRPVLRVAAIAAAAGIALWAGAWLLWQIQNVNEQQQQQAAELRDQEHRRNVGLRQWQDDQAEAWQRANKQLRADLSQSVMEQLLFQRQYLKDVQEQVSKTIVAMQAEIERLSAQLGQQKQQSAEAVKNLEAERQKLQEAVRRQQDDLAQLSEKLKAATEQVQIGLANRPEELTSPGDEWANVPLSQAAQKAVGWLVLAQASDGGWGQEINDGRAKVASAGSDVANTCVATLALLRAGHTPTQGKYKDNLQKSVNYVVVRVEESPQEGLTISTREGTQIQVKVGSAVDTFLASMVLAEVDGNMADIRANSRVRGALQKVVVKIEKSQQPDGSWNGTAAWAPILGTSFASRSLDLARRKGVAVKPQVLEKVEKWTKERLGGEKSPGDAGKGSAIAKATGAAGVRLYEIGQAYEQLSRTEKDRQDNAAALKALAKELYSDEVVRGFGSMGGEEFLSYFNVSDGLRRTGGEDWKNWNTKITLHLEKIQNADGTWAGHHCITGRVTCTGAAALALLAERAH